jgi:hypothetical protein
MVVMIKNVSLDDWISLVVGIGGVVSAYLASRDRLPIWARRWLKKIGNQKVIEAIERAAAFAELDSDEKRKQAVIYLQKTTITELGFPVPASIANLLVEHIYQQWKKAKQ